VLEGADVAALPADDAALHVVGLQLDDGDGRLRRVAGGQALHHDRQDVAHAPLGVPFRLLLDGPHPAGRFVADLVLELLQQDRLGLRRRQAGRALERPDRLVAHVVDLRLARGHPPLALGDLVLPLLERLLAGEQATVVGWCVLHRALFGVRRVGLRPGARGADPGRARRQDLCRDHQTGREAQGHHDRRDHSFHCVSSPLRRCPWAATRVHSLSVETRQVDPCPAQAGDEQEGDRAAAPSDGGCDAVLGRLCRARPPGCGA
jgi:hypothetical protein